MDSIFEELVDLSSCAQTIRIVDRPSQLDFANIARMNQPVIITNAINDWPAMKKWNFEYLSRNIEAPASVAITPTGSADAIGLLDNGERAFFLPHEETMLFRDFQRALQSSKTDNESAVFYVQQQNSNFTADKAYARLQQDVPNDDAAGGPFAFARGVFTKPDAINFWCGNERATTSWHKDNYDNLYAVVSGTKIFKLLPPSDVVRLPYREFTMCQWQRVGDSGVVARKSDFKPTIVEPRSTVPWIDLPDEMNELLKPIEFRLEAGEILYLPPLWFHHVNQIGDDEGKCVAINAWFDMKPGCEFAFQHFAQRIAQRFRFNK